MKAEERLQLLGFYKFSGTGLYRVDSCYPRQQEKDAIISELMSRNWIPYQHERKRKSVQEHTSIFSVGDS